MLATRGKPLSPKGIVPCMEALEPNIARETVICFMPHLRPPSASFRSRKHALMNFNTQDTQIRITCMCEWICVCVRDHVCLSMWLCSLSRFSLESLRHALMNFNTQDTQTRRTCMCEWTCVCMRDHVYLSISLCFLSRFSLETPHDGVCDSEPSTCLGKILGVLRLGTSPCLRKIGPTS